MISPLIDASVNHARTVILILVLLLIAGLNAYIEIPKESEPDIDIPQIYVSMALEGVSPEDAERLLLRPVEQELTAIEGVKEMKAAAYQGGGYVLLEFKAGFDKDRAKEDVQQAVDRVRPELPDSLENEPTVTEVNFSLFPVLVVMLSGDVPERTLLRLARELQDRIEALPAVLEAPVAGNREEQVEIVISPELIESYNLDGIGIINFFTRSNRLVAAGSLDTGAGSFSIQVPGLIENVHDIMNMPVRVNGDSVVRVSDVAELRRTFKDPENFARLNGKPAIAIEVVKRSGENIIDTIAAVREVVAKESQFWQDNVEISFTQDRSKDIRAMLSELQNGIIAAVILVMIVIIAALGVQGAALAGIAIPGSFLIGILVIYAMGFTVNIVVLFSLILATGMLVDDAIIVTEYADRKLAEGVPRREAYAMAAKRMAWPVISATATRLAAFAPMMFWPGIVGEFMKYLPLTLICTLSASLLMALVFVPTLGSLFGKASAAGDEDGLKMLAAAEQGNLEDIKGMTGWYLSFLGAALKRPGLVLVAAAALLVGVQMAYGAFGKGVEFFPAIEPEVASILVHARGNLSIYEKDALVKEVEKEVLGVEGVDTVYTRSGKAAQRGGEMAEDVIGQIQIEFKEWNERRKAQAILGEILEKTQNIAGVQVEAQEQEAGPPGGKDIQIQLASRFPEKLPVAVAQVRAALDALGGFVAVEDSRPLPGIEWELQVDRAQAAKFNLDVSTIGEYVRMVTNGLRAAQYRPNDSDDEIDIVIRHAAEERTLDQLDRVRVESALGSIPVSNFIRRVAQPATGTINRTDGMRVMTVKADVAPGANIAQRVADIQKWMEENRGKLDPAVSYSFRGEDEDQRESQAFLMNAFVAALFIMMIILVTQFNSFSSVLIILSAVVMSTIGVFGGLLLIQQPFGIVMSGIGTIALAGIIVNNNIILIDTFDHLRRGYPEMALREIIMRTGAQRLRPVLLTAVTAILGLLPMVFQMSIDFVHRTVEFGAPSTQWWVQLSTAIAFGLAFSTILTLIVTPCALAFRENIGRGTKGLFGKIKGRIMRRLPARSG